MCLMQISTLHGTLGTQSGIRGAGGEHREGLCRVTAGPTSHLCILPPFPWQLLISSSHRGRGRASRQGTEQPRLCRRALQSHCSARAPGIETNTPGPFLHVPQRQRRAGLGLGDRKTPLPTQTYSSHFLPTFLHQKASPCFVSCFPFPASAHGFSLFQDRAALTHRALDS